MTMRIHRILSLLLSLILLILALTSCTNGNIDAPVSDAFYAFTDDTGVTIELSKKPQRVAVLFSSLADVWVSAGGNVSITVGESVERGFTDANAILVDAGAGKTINTELLIAAQPDFVICSADVEKQVQAAALLNRSGIPAACFRIESFADYLRVLKICTDVTEDASAYQANGIAVRDRIDAMLSALPELQAAPDVLFVRAGSSFIKAKTADLHFAAAMLEEIGAYNIANDAPILLDGLNDEVIVQKDPSYIFVSTMGNETAAKNFIAQNVVWQTLTAVREGKCVYLPKDLFQYKPNARWDEAYRYLIAFLYETEQP
ncbi:MAG: ABC transporter substrate-binding protein [Clostridia bacterium]|nr:ABC transporter substrate-binding protein [Clostridia bacterium]